MHLRRAIPVTEQTIHESLERFDEAVARIEICRAQELQQGQIIATWGKNPEDKTCVACDARTFCPSYTAENEPKLPM